MPDDPQPTRLLTRIADRSCSLWVAGGWLLTPCRAPRLVMAVRGGGGARLPGGGCPSPGLRQGGQFLQRGCWRLSRCLMQLVKQQLGDDMQACDEVTQVRRSSGIRACTAHASNSGESRLAVRNQ